MENRDRNCLDERSFIKNHNELSNVPEECRKTREFVLDALEKAMASVHPDTTIPENVSLSGNFLDIGGREFSLKGRLAVIGMGKAAYHMALALDRILGERVDYGIVNSIKEERIGNIEVRRAAHPFPDAQTVRSTEKAVELAKSLGKDDLAIVLISGGGSSMFCLPHPDVGLEEITGMTKEMMEKGADIWELNTVRRSLSMVKGGGLAAYLRPAGIISLIISDVVDNHLPSIASGPTVAVEDEGEKAEEILRKYGLWDNVSEGVRKAIRERKERGNADLNLIIADNRRTVNHASVVLTSHGMDHHIFHGIRGDVREIAESIAGMRMSAVMGGETTTEVRGNGTGGRNQELVLRTLSLGFEGTIASLGTDGIDGNSPYAGAIADEYTLKIAEEKGLDTEEFLNNSDSASFFEKTGGAIRTGYTGTNVADLVVVVKRDMARM